MIRGYVLGFSRPDKETRYGDCELITDGKKYILIDGYCGKGADAIIAYLKKRKIKKLILILTHAHYDHYNGLWKIIKDPYFEVEVFYCYDPLTLEAGLSNNKGSKSVREDIENLQEVIAEAEKRDIKVVFLDHGDKIEAGDIKLEVYREQPTKVADDDTEGWSYVNDGSLCFYMRETGYWTSGDGCEYIYNFIKKLNKLGYNIVVKYFKIPHHGNNCTESQAKGLKAQGAKVCWYNDLEPKGIGTTEFTAYGARRCREAGIPVLEAVGDINWVAFKNSMHIYHGGKEVTSFSCDYSGNSSFKALTADVVRKVFEDKYGKGDTRVTNILDDGYYYTAVQSAVNTVVNIANDIIHRRVNYGKNATRIKNLDKMFGAGYGQLIQDEINSLLKAKSAKW